MFILISRQFFWWEKNKIKYHPRKMNNIAISVYMQKKSVNQYHCQILRQKTFENQSTKETMLRYNFETSSNKMEQTSIVSRINYIQLQQ